MRLLIDLIKLWELFQCPATLLSKVSDSTILRG